MKWGAVVEGTIAGLVTSLLGSALMAASVYFTDFAQRHSEPFQDGVAIASVLVAGLWVGRRAQTSGLLHGAVTGIGFLVAGSVLGFLFFSGFPGLTFLGVRLVLAVALGAVAGVLGVNA